MTLTVVQFLSAFERSRKLSGVSPSQSRKCQKRRSYCSQVSSALTASRKILTDSPSRWGNFLLVIPHILNPPSNIGSTLTVPLLEPKLWRARRDSNPGSQAFIAIAPKAYTTTGHCVLSWLDYGPG